MKELIIYAYWVIYEFIYFHDKLKHGFITHWRKAWRNYYVRPNWYEKAREIHARQVQEVNA